MGKNQAFSILNTWEISEPTVYFVATLILSLVVRTISAVLKAFERPPEISFFSDFWISFKGFHKDPQKADYWYPFIIGVLEFSSYPILMVTGNWRFIGAWLAFKTLAQWKYWGETRPSFNRFLIGNAFVVILSVLLLTGFVNMKKSPTELKLSTNLVQGQSYNNHVLHTYR